MTPAAQSAFTRCRDISIIWRAIRGNVGTSEGSFQNDSSMIHRSRNVTPAMFMVNNLTQSELRETREAQICWDFFFHSAPSSNQIFLCYHRASTTKLREQPWVSAARSVKKGLKSKYEIWKKKVFKPELFDCLFYCYNKNTLTWRAT